MTSTRLMSGLRRPSPDPSYSSPTQWNGIFPSGNHFLTFIQVTKEIKTCRKDELQKGILTAVDDFVEKENQVRVGVINISFKIGDGSGMMNALKHANDNRMHVVVGAGNDGIDPPECSVWKKLEKRDWTIVGATNLRDEKWENSNYGECVDIYAPGEGISVAGTQKNSALVWKSGTSYSTPLVAGVVAIIGASNSELAKDPSEMKNEIVRLSAKNKIDGFPPNSSSHNRILQSPVQVEIVLGDENSSGGSLKNSLGI